MLPIFVGTSLLLILTDSLYYGDLTVHKLWHLSMKYSDWKVLYTYCRGKYFLI